MWAMHGHPCSRTQRAGRCYNRSPCCFLWYVVVDSTSFYPPPPFPHTDVPSFLEELLGISSEKVCSPTCSSDDDCKNPLLPRCMTKESDSITGWIFGGGSLKACKAHGRSTYTIALEDTGAEPGRIYCSVSALAAHS